MSDNDNTTTEPTRRDTLKYGGAAAAGLALAGCSGMTGGGDGSVDNGGDGSCSVTMELVGTLEFEQPPETWFPFTGEYADMCVALGQGDSLEAIGLAS